MGLFDKHTYNSSKHRPFRDVRFCKQCNNSFYGHGTQKLCDDCKILED